MALKLPCTPLLYTPGNCHTKTLTLEHHDGEKDSLYSENALVMTATGHEERKDYISQALRAVDQTGPSFYQPKISTLHSAPQGLVRREELCFGHYLPSLGRAPYGTRELPMTARDEFELQSPHSLGHGPWERAYIGVRGERREERDGRR